MHVEDAQERAGEGGGRSGDEGGCNGMRLEAEDDEPSLSPASSPCRESLLVCSRDCVAAALTFGLAPMKDEDEEAALPFLVVDDDDGVDDGEVRTVLAVMTLRPIMIAKGRKLRLSEPHFFSCLADCDGLLTATKGEGQSEEERPDDGALRFCEEREM